MATESEASNSAPKVFATYEILETILIDVLTCETEGISPIVTRIDRLR